MKKLIIIAIIAALIYYGWLSFKVSIDKNNNTASLDISTGSTDYVKDAINAADNAYHQLNN